MPPVDLNDHVDVRSRIVRGLCEQILTSRSDDDFGGILSDDVLERVRITVATRTVHDYSPHLDKDDLALKYVSGESVEDIASGIDRGVLAVSRRLRKAGFTWRRIGRGAEAIPAELHGILVKLYEEGNPSNRLADRLGVSDVTVVGLLKKLGVEVRAFEHMSGSNHPSWTGGRTVDKKGYVKVNVNGAYTPEHRIVMSNYLGRPLEDWETVHHINGLKHDNRLENLQLRIGQHGPGVAVKCGDCGSHRIEYVHLGGDYATG